MKSSAVSVSIIPGPPLGRDSVAIRPSGSPVVNVNASAAAGNGITITANVSAAIPVRAFKGMNDWSVMIFLRRPVWKIVAVNDSGVSPASNADRFVRHDPFPPARYPGGWASACKSDPTEFNGTPTAALAAGPIRVASGHLRRIRLGG